MRPITAARLTIIAFAMLTWLIAWSLRFLPNPIKNPIAKLGLLLSFILAGLGGMIVQIAAYRWLSGVRLLQDDHFFMGTFILEYLIGTGIIILGAFERDRKNRSRALK